MEPRNSAFASGARALREAREKDGLSQRELARRAGIAPSVVSRIESRAVRSPDVRTTDRLAAALGRSAKALYLLFGDEHWTWAIGDDILPEEPWVFQAREEFVSADGDHAAVDARWHARVLDAVADHFVATTLSRRLDGHVFEDDVREALERIASRWPGISEPRRELVLAFVEDQLSLSELERRQAA